MEAIRKIQQYDQSQIVASLGVLEQVLQSGNRARECVDAMRLLLQLLTLNGSYSIVPSPLLNAVFNMLTEKNLVPRLRYLAMFLLREAACVDLPIFRGTIDVDRSVVPYVVPLLVTLGQYGVVRPLIPVAVSWAVQREADLRNVSLPLLAATAQADASLIAANDVRTLETDMTVWLQSASKVATSSGFWKIGSNSSVPVTEMDGTAAREAFTCLSYASQYSTDQMLNIHCFSMMHRWLVSLYVPKGGDGAPAAERVLEAGFKEAIVQHVMRVATQSEVDTSDAAAKIPAADRELCQSVLHEAVRLMDDLCNIDAELVPRLFPQIKRVFTRAMDRPVASILLACLSFFHRHSELVGHDPEPMFTFYFGTFLPAYVTQPTVGLQTLLFLLQHQRTLLTETNVFTLYFPTILQLAAWYPHSHAAELFELLPAMIDPSTYVELLHLVLDLPLTAAAMERAILERSTAWDTVDAAQRKRIERLRPLTTRFMRLQATPPFSPVWDAPEMIPLIEEFCWNLPFSPRVSCLTDLVPQLLERYFDIMLQFGDETAVAVVVELVLSRVGAAQMYTHEKYRTQTIALLTQKLLAVFEKYPNFVYLLKRQIVQLLTEALAANRLDLGIVLCWAVGEYASPAVDPRCTLEVMDDFHTTLQMLVFELITSGDTARDATLTTRLLHALISALAKLAARARQLVPSVMLCLSKVLRSGQMFDESVTFATRQYLTVLKIPGVASAILDPPRSADVTTLDENSSLPFVLQASLPAPEGGVPHKPLHGFML